MASSSAVSSAEKPTSSLRRLDTAALAAASGVRRSWLTADSSERRSSSAWAIASALPASSVSSRCLTRPAACLATAVSTRRSRAASFRPPSSIQNSSSPTSIAVSAVSTFSARVGAHARDDLASRVPSTRSRLTARCEYVSRTRSSRVSRSAPRSTDPANRASSSASCDARRASRARLAAPSTSGGHRDGDREQHDDGDRAVGLGDGEGVARFDQEVVQQQPGEQRRQGRRRDAAEQRDHQHADEEQGALAADPEEAVQQQDRDRADRRGHDDRGEPGRRWRFAGRPTTTTSRSWPARG